MQTKAKDNWKLFKPSACSLALKGSTKEEIFTEVVSTLIRAKALSADLKDGAVQALVDREGIASTGVGSNVAIPHVKLAGLEQPVFSVSLLPSGIDWSSVDGEPAKIFFVVLRPERAGASFDPDRHLEMMRWISELARVADFRRFALAASTKKELVELLREMPGL
jgi:mannitol/fructose-specific phosphotransferase system IIA component (Ntr-type)